MKKLPDPDESEESNGPADEQNEKPEPDQKPYSDVHIKKHILVIPDIKPYPDVPIKNRMQMYR